MENKELLRKIIQESLRPIFDDFSNKPEPGIKIEKEIPNTDTIEALSELNSDIPQNENEA